jgi:hypothetical protein
MKFEDMKKIWDEQSQQHLYVIDENALQKSIQIKKNGASRFINKMEWFMILANLVAGGMIITMNFIKHPGDYYANLLGIAMIGAAIYVYLRRLQRLRNENRFNRTMLGDLEHAISNATYRARLSYTMLMYFVMVTLLIILNAIHEEKSLAQILLLTAFCVIIWLLGRWEHRSWHLANKKRLEAMREKLIESV